MTTLTMDRSARMPLPRRPEPTFSHLSERAWERLHGVATQRIRGRLVAWVS